MNNIFKKRKPSIATGLVKPKTTSLFFDKIWLPEIENIVFDETIPRNILYVPPILPQDIIRFRTLMDHNVKMNRRENINFEFHMMSNTELPISQIKNEKKIKYDEIEFKSSHNRNRGIREFVESMKKRYDVDITPIYIDKVSFEDDFFDDTNKDIDNCNPIAVVLEQVPLIYEEKLEWEQVQEIRKDKKSIARLHKFRNWVSTDLSKCSKEEIICTYDKTLEEYKEALKKYGITTAMGAFSIVLNSAGMIIEKFGQDVYNQLSAGIMITAGLTAFTVNQCQTYIEEKNKPIAYIYDILKKIEK